MVVWWSRGPQLRLELSIFIIPRSRQPLSVQDPGASKRRGQKDRPDSGERDLEFKGGGLVLFVLLFASWPSPSEFKFES